MNHHVLHKKDENKDRLKSGIITAAVWSALLLFLFWYKIVEKMPEKKEIETKMLINFGDNSNGNGTEEPANEEGSAAAEITPATEETSPNTLEKNLTKENSYAKPIPTEKKTTEKIITGNNKKNSVKTTETDKDFSAKSAKNTTAKNSAGKNSGTKNAAGNSKTGSGDGKGNAAIGNLIRGRGTKSGAQGNGSGAGNSGDLLGGNSDGDSKIGIDRKLISYIPGTMGRGGAKPSHSCEASGSITISYTVDKAGNVVSARRSGGISDPCIASTSISWVKKYVKAEKATSSSTGTYKITF